MGALPADGFAEFLRLREVVARFLSESYGSCAEFEHGVVGQTVFHAHFHMLPFDGKGKDAVPEDGALRTARIASLPDEFARQGSYLYLRARDGEFFVDTELGAPRFFRDRIAAAIGEPERGSWQAMRKDPALMRTVETEICELERRSKGYLS